MNSVDLGAAVLASLLETIPPAKAQFVSWAIPGLPFEKDAFDFATKGLEGGDEAARIRTLRAAEWARVTDFIPNSGYPYGEAEQAKMFQVTTLPGSLSVSGAYGAILQFCQVPSIAGFDLLSHKAERLRKMTNLIRTSEEVGEFAYTTVNPSNFVERSGWTWVSYSLNEILAQNTDTQRSRSSHIDLRGSFWRAGSSTLTQSESFLVGEIRDFHLSFELLQIGIHRPWFDTDFLLSNAWRFPPGLSGVAGTTAMISDGGDPPKGPMPAYPIAAIFVRNVQIACNSLSTADSQIRKEIETNGGFRFGPFALGGSYQRGSTEYSQRGSLEGNTWTVPGLQLIGFRCKSLPKLPDPAPDVEQWV